MTTLEAAEHQPVTLDGIKQQIHHRQWNATVYYPHGDGRTPSRPHGDGRTQERSQLLGRSRLTGGLHALAGTAPAIGDAPFQDHQANGAAEQGVRLAQGYARTLLAGIAHALGVQDIPESSPVIPYAVRHGAWLYTKHVLGPDGNTAWEALKGKEYRAALAQFGEVVHYSLVPGHADSGLTHHLAS